MSELKRDIIIKEIKYWKEHRLLPEQYCNFLLTLYTEGDSESYQDSSFPIKKVTYFCLLYLLGSLFPITFLVIYFTELLLVLQIVLFLFFMIISLITSRILFKKGLKGFHIPLLSGCLIFFLSTVHLVEKFFSETPSVMLVTLVACCLVWSFVGLKANILYLKVAGVLGTGFVLFYYFL